MVESIRHLIEECGFDAIGRFDAVGLEARHEVRDMCAANRCHAHDTNWACPPACGSIAEFQKLFSCYMIGYVFQTIAHMEDEFDHRAIEEASTLHAQRFHNLVDKLGSSAEPSHSSADEHLSGVAGKPLLLSAGACSICPQCSYPDEPCRFPDKIYPSLEAAGLLVSDVCKLAGIPYYHGRNTIAFVSCVLI
jgi:predicted metal-binding protein